MARVDREPTGERMIPEQYQATEHMALLRLFHTTTYRFAESFGAGKDVLDYGCGTGYGSAMVASRARSVRAVDVAADAIAYAREHYARQNLEFQVIEPNQPLPFSDGSFDSVISCQVIEHVTAPDAYLREVVRVLRRRGVLVLATPDRRTRLLPLQRPWNRWHLTEYSERSLNRLLSPHFAEIEHFTMGGESSLLEIELRRTRRLKWGTLPFTLPIVPNALRVGMIASISALARLRRRVSRPPNDKQPSSKVLTEGGVSIGKGLWPSVNLIVVARRS
jgi:ubiquinone/menaquinone biosynthesis C-methylase UbiE